MHMLTHRLQILLDEERHRQLVELAEARKVSVATVVREAIDRGLAQGRGHRRAAGERFLSAEPMPVPDDVDELLSELDDLRGRRG